MNGQVERPERTTLVLTSEINAWLDAECASMRRTTGTCFSRSELLRAILRGMIELAAADFSKCRTEEDIAMVLFCGGLDEADDQTRDSVNGHSEAA